ncbi:MAG: hypothetical protein M0P47_11785 [Bacteroidales bacterium]|nr:hypothetical protein [Bacteroidales bacterium]
MIKCALLIEVASIQQYIFSSNKLKENVGASYIIEHMLFSKDGIMHDVICDLYKCQDFNLDEWNIDNDAKQCSVGYIGGGNALLFFDDHHKVKEFMTEFSKRCLVQFPSLKLVYGFNEKFDTETMNYQSEFKKLAQNLQQNKSCFLPLTTIPKHGITADCPWSNETAEFSYEDLYISSTTKAKLVANHIASGKLEQYFQVDEQYCFSNEIEKLGQKKEGSYIAVIHIDGNGMGNIFSSIHTLPLLRAKSQAVNQKALSAMRKLIGYIIERHKKNDLDELQLKCEDGKTILPIRPILLGGDDITFITEGRIGFHLAEKFIGFFYDKEEQEKGRDSSEKLMNGACAGVAIVKSHFPFYKAVKLAEELCTEAKNMTRQLKDTRRNCFISYYYSSTTFSGTLKNLRKRTHFTPNGNCYSGPFLLFDDTAINSVKQLKMLIIEFKKNKEKWPQNKLMQLRELIPATAGEHLLFEKEMKEKEEFDLHIWEKGITSYFDPIELMEFYPEKLLNK